MADEELWDHQVLEGYRKLLWRLVAPPILAYSLLFFVHPMGAGCVAALLYLVGAFYWCSKVPATPGQAQGQICLGGCLGLLLLAVFFATLGLAAIGMP